MPGKGLVLNIISVILQYGILFLLYCFLYRIVKLMYQDFMLEVDKVPLPRRLAAKLRVIDSGGGALAQDCFAVTAQLSLGRAGDNDVIIADTYVSQHHAIIAQCGQQYIIEDLGSINHTYVNDIALTEKVYLQTGDIIKIGFVTFKFER